LSLEAKILTQPHDDSQLFEKVCRILFCALLGMVSGDWQPLNLATMVDSLISVEALPSDFLFVSQIRGSSMLPVKAILAHPAVVRLHVTEADLQKACSKSVFCPDPCIVLPFFVEPRVLIVSGFCGAKQAEFRNFVIALLGHQYVEIHPYLGENSFKARFADIPTAMCFWRALNYAAFKGMLVSVVALSSLMPIEEVNQLTPRGRRKNNHRVMEHRRNRLKKIEESSVPAVIPRAVLLSGAMRLPCAPFVQDGRDE
jgi:hypothetical protein